MQKVVTIRASQKDLEFVIEKFISYGWRVLNTARGSEWGRVGISYKWTIILELGENDYNADEKINSIIREFSSKSYVTTSLLVFGIIVGFLCLIVFAVSL